MAETQRTMKELALVIQVLAAVAFSLFSFDSCMCILYSSVENGVTIYRVI